MQIHTNKTPTLKSYITVSATEFALSTTQGLSQKLEIGCPKLANVKFWVSYFSKENTIYSEYNHKHVLTLCHAMRNILRWKNSIICFKLTF